MLSFFYFFSDTVQKTLFSVTDELLREHFGLLLCKLEPRDIADIMFQEGYISVTEHDDVTDLSQIRKQLTSLLDILQKKKLHTQFLCTLQFLDYHSALNLLMGKSELKNKTCEFFPVIVILVRSVLKILYFIICIIQPIPFSCSHVR